MDCPFEKKNGKSLFTIAAAGSALLIVLYIASQTMSLPIVGIQDDIGTIDTVSKMMEGITVGLSAYAISISRKINGRLRIEYVDQ